MAVSCQKEKIPVKPSIHSFNVSATTMNSATFNFSVSNFTTLKLTIDGVTVDVSGGTYTHSGLVSNKSYTAVLTATNADGSVNSSQSFTTAKSSLAAQVKIIDSTMNGATFSLVANSNASIVSQTLINVNTSESIDVTSKTTHSVNNLVPDSSYTFTFKVKDNTGNEVSQNVTFKTKEKASEWFSMKKVTYEYQFDIIGNAVSAKLTIETNNSASSAKTLDYLSAGFGEYGKAVKMLRYSLNGGNWVRSIASPEGVVAFTNVTFQPGDNTFESYFSLKPNVGGVPNNSPLSFSFITMHDREGGTLPKGGSFPAAVPVGRVNAAVQPTVITTTWLGDAYVNAGEVPHGTIYSDAGLYQQYAIRATGPTGARLTNIRLKNPYASFTGLEFDNSSWSYYNTGATKTAYITNYFWETEVINSILQYKFINLTLPNDFDNNILMTDGVSYNNYYIRCKIRNSNHNTFFSGTYTPERFGLELVSKYDITIKNSNGQVVDLSDVVVKHGDTVLQN